VNGPISAAAEKSAKRGLHRATSVTHPHAAAHRMIYQVSDGDPSRGIDSIRLAAKRILYSAVDG